MARQVIRTKIVGKDQMDTKSTARNEPQTNSRKMRFEDSVKDFESARQVRVQCRREKIRLGHRKGWKSHVIDAETAAIRRMCVRMRGSRTRENATSVAKWDTSRLSADTESHAQIVTRRDTRRRIAGLDARHVAGRTISLEIISNLDAEAEVTIGAITEAEAITEEEVDTEETGTAE